MEKYLAILLEKKESDKGVVYIPSELLSLEKKEDKYYDKDKKEYNVFDINGIKDNAISFIISFNDIKQLLNSDDLNSIINCYVDIVNKYYILYKDNEYKFMFNNEDELVFSEYYDHFLNQISSVNLEFNPVKLYNSLKSRVFMQDEAIKKVFLALSLHYMDDDETEKAKIIIDGEKGTGKSEIINTLKDCMPVSVLVEDLGDVNFSFDALFLSLLNTKDLSKCPILVLDNADKILLGNDLYNSEIALKTIKHLMLGIDYKLKTETGTINYETKDFSIIVMGDFSKRAATGINNYLEGVPSELSKLTNYNIKMNPVTKELIYKKLMDEEYGVLSHYARFLDNFGITLAADNKIVDNIVNKVMDSNMHELDKIVENCFEELIFELLTSDKKYEIAGINYKTLKNNKKYLLK